MPNRFQYRVTLVDRQATDIAALPVGIQQREVESADPRGLAELMLEAYRDTIDYDGESQAEALEEVNRYLSPNSENPPLLSHSTLLASHSRLVCACLVMRWLQGECPLIGYIITHPAFKRRGLAALALAESLRRLKFAGEFEVRAVITEGNIASEQLFRNAGFTRVDGQ
jgi:RimJ/RimL family protein N-acetyltransferase